MSEGGGLTQSYLQFDRVTKSFGPVPVVSEASLVIDRNSLVVFLGPSGCGKTTLMRMAGGLDTPSSGTIRLDGWIVRYAQKSAKIFHCFHQMACFLLGQSKRIACEA